MASGTITLNTPKATVEGYIKWSSQTGSLTGNYSLVSASIYLRKTDGYTSWGTFSGSLTIGGTSYSFSKYASLGSAYVKIAEKSDVRINHNSDGTRSVTIAASFKMADTTIAGTYSASKSVTLDVIKRLSYCTGPFAITAGEPFTLNISRYSSSFLHDISIIVDGQTIRKATNYGEKITFSSDSYQNSIFSALNGSLTKACTIRLETKSDGTVLGGVDYAGTITAQDPGLLTLTLSSAYIGQTQGIAVSQPADLYTYAGIYTFGEVQESLVMNQSTATLSVGSAFAQNMPADVNEAQCKISVQAYYGAVPVGGSLESSFLVKLTEEDRSLIFNQTNVTCVFLDTAVTGSSQKFINRAGTIRLTIPEADKAQARYQAYITGYRLQMGEKSLTVSGSGGSGDLVMELTGGTGRIAELLVMDSRGNTAQYTYTVDESDFIDYTPLTLTTFRIYRENGFDDTVKLQIEGTAWKGNFGLADNSISFIYQVKKAGTEQTVSPAAITGIAIGADGAFQGTYTLSSGTGEFDIDSAYLIEGEVSDCVSALEKTVTVNSAIIGMYLKRNQDLYHLGVNCKPDEGELSGSAPKAGLSVKGDLRLLSDAASVKLCTDENGVLQLDSDVALAAGSSVSAGGNPLPAVLQQGSNYVELDLGTHILRMNWGSVVAQVTETDTPVGTAVSYKSGFFTEAPFVTVAPRSSVVGSYIKGVGFYNNTENGCDIYVYRTNKTNFSVIWKAITITAK